MKKIFTWVSLITGVLPGIAVILNGFGTPEELRKPYGIIAAACGFVAFGLVLLIKECVRRGNKKTLAALIIVFGFIGWGSLCAYWIILDQCAFQSAGHSAVFFPVWLDGRAKESVDRAGGRIAYYQKYGAGAVSTLMESQTDQLERTKHLLLVFISTASVALPVASGIASAFADRRSGKGPSSAGTRGPGKAPLRRKAQSKSGGTSKSYFTDVEYSVTAYGSPCLPWTLIMNGPASPTAWTKPCSSRSFNNQLRWTSVSANKGLPSVWTVS